MKECDGRMQGLSGYQKYIPMTSSCVGAGGSFTAALLGVVGGEAGGTLPFTGFAILLGLGGFGGLCPMMGGLCPGTTVPAWTAGMMQQNTRCRGEPWLKHQNRHWKRLKVCVCVCV